MDNLWSNKIKKHFVVSGYIVFDHQVLLIVHRKLYKWLPPGGHIDEFETPDEAILREIDEETKLTVEILAPKCTQGDDQRVQTLFTPCHMQVENIDDLHQHIDLIYFCAASHNRVQFEVLESIKARWFSADELNEHEDIYFDGIMLPKHVSFLGLLAISSVH